MSHSLVRQPQNAPAELSEAELLVYVLFLGKACYLVSCGLMGTKKLLLLFLRTRSRWMLVPLKLLNVQPAAGEWACGQIAEAGVKDNDHKGVT